MAIHPTLETLPRRPEWASVYHGARMTEEEYFALPEEKPYLEYVDGVVLQKPMVNQKHSRLVRRIDARLDAYIDTHGGDGGPERRVRLGDTSNHFLPDTGYWAPGRPNHEDSVPTVAIEVRSPDQTFESQRTKCRRYRANGVEVCWLIDPEARGVEVFEGGRDAERLRADGALETALMPGFSLPLAELWAVLDRE